MNLEDFLLHLSASGPLCVIGGSPLYQSPAPPRSISLNARRSGADTAAINASQSDLRRARRVGFKMILMPNPQGTAPALDVLVPSGSYPLPAAMPQDVLPTTCLSLLLICQAIGVRVNLYGVCGWASKWHDGDWEMHWIKRALTVVTVHDPRPRW